MMRLRRAAVVIMLPLLTWAATASAECAWALWVEDTRQAAETCTVPREDVLIMNSQPSGKE